MPSPSPSARDRSAVSTPPARRSASPPRGQYYAYDMSRGYPGGYVYGPPPQHTPYPDGRARYEQHPHPQYAPAPYPVPHGGYVPYPLPGTVLSAPPPSSQPPSSVEIVHTDDAATKLSDRVRRRCFNCCTTDTSTWRRSNLSPGKVLCNKCGLFERTHSRPRPDQFPHKRGPLASANLGSRSPKAAPQQYSPPNTAPPHENGSASHPPTPNPAESNGVAHPRLPGVDSLRPPKSASSGDKREPAERRERPDTQTEEVRER